MKANGVNLYQIFKVVALCLVILPAIGSAKDDSHELAMNAHIRGKGRWNTCDMFARDLCQHMACAGTEAHYVVYDWQDDFHGTGRHAFVVYRDSDGRYWGMDNRSVAPKWLSGQDPVEWVASFAGDIAAKFVDAWRTTSGDSSSEDASAYAVSLHARKFAKLVLAPNPTTIP